MNARSRALLLLLLVAAAAALVPFLDYLTDDTFIHLQFAKHLVQGKGFAFNAGEPTYGATSPLWVLLLALAGKILPIAVAAPADPAVMPDLAWVAKGLGLIAHLITIVTLVLLGKRIGWDDRTSLGLGLLLGAQAWALRWAVSGMETPLAAACVALALYGLAGVLVRRRAGWMAGVFLGLASLARPECHLLAAVAVVAVWMGSERRVRRSLEVLAGIALVVLPWLAIAWRWFHTLLPNTAAAKAGARLEPGLMIAAVHSVFQVELAADALPLALFVLVLAFGNRATALPGSRGRRFFWLTCVAWPTLLVVSFALEGVQVVSRYMIPATPCVLLLGMASFRWVVANNLPKRYGMALAVFLAAFVLQNAAFTALVSAPNTRAHTRGLRASLASIGVWARDHTPPDASFAAADIGAFGYYSERRVLDLYGLVTPVMAPIVVREGYDAVVTRCLFEAAGRPDYLIDRHRAPGRLATEEDQPSPYRLLFTRRIENLGITRPGGFFYSVYAIDWRVVDETRQRVAARPVARRGSGGVL
ncbi:MAG TPA: hypothetical protein VEU09_10955 [Candidatus Binatia bacterium]|nr:hypothetical protein [Candidatus Binatia bacterium]